MRKHFLHITLVVFLIQQSWAQSPTIVWTNTFTYGYFNYAHEMALDSQHNIIMGGRFEIYQNPNPTIRGSFTNKVDPNGNVIWFDTLSPERIDGIAVSSTDLYTIGSSITKKSLNNVMAWKKDSVYGRGITYLNNAIYTVGDNFYKYDLSGNLIWTKPLGAWGGRHVKTTMNYLYVGECDLNVCMIDKFDTLGNLLWSSSSGMGNVNMTTDKNGNCYLIGNSMTRKFNSAGTIEWTVQSDSLAWYNATIYNDTVYICGSTGKDEIGGNSYIRRSSISLYNSQTGAFISNHYLDIFPGVAEQANFILKDGSNIYLSGAGGYQMATLYLSKISFINVATGIKPITLTDYDFALYPNPSCGIFTISGTPQKTSSVCVYDVLGNCVLNKTQITHGEKIDLSKFSKGVYFVELSSEDERLTQKLIIE